MAIKSAYQHHYVRRVWTVRSIVFALFVVSAYLIFEYGRIKAGYDRVEVANDTQAFEQRIERLDDEIIELKQEVALLETNRVVDRESYREVEVSLASLQVKIQEQRDAIAFYRGIVSPSDGNSGLRVQNLKLSRGKAERAFKVRLVLVQAMKHDRKVSGDVNLSVVGELNGIETTYVLAQLLPEDAQQAWRYSFRYFQDFERQIVLPDGFKPERITVEVRSKTRSISSIEESFAWLASQS